MEPITDDDIWKKAAFLPERVIKRTWPDRSDKLRLREEAERRAKAWQKSMMSYEAAFEERLELLGLDREAFLQLLAGAEVEVDAWTDRGAWLDTLHEVLERRHRDEPLPSLHATHARANLPLFLGFLEPFLQTGAARLRAGVAAIRARHRRSGALLDERAETALLAGLAWGLQGKALGLLVLELHIAKLRGKLPEGTPQERFDYFATTYFNDAGALHDVLRKAPVLARLLATTLERWTEVSLEFLERLAQDWTLIRDRFASGTELGELAALNLGISDVHRGGRSVVQLEFTSGLKLVYKPRSLAIEVKFQDLLAWLNAKGVSAPHRLLTVADRGSYGWVEFVEAAACEDREGVERFYFRQGSYLALLHVLKAIDMHQENLIAASEHPVFVDLEALFHHDVPVPKEDTAIIRALRYLGDTILSIGILPLVLPQAGQQVDVSAIGGEQGQIYPQQMRMIADPRHDTMRVVRHPPTSQASNNRPRLRGEELDPSSFVGELVDGFEETYRLILRNREELAGALRTFADVEIRHLLRPTMRYAFFLSEGSHPDFLRDALEQDRLLDKLWVEAGAVPSLRRIIPFETADLRLGDIPMFTARPGQRHLWSSTGELIDDFFEYDSLSQALERLARMNEAHCASQVALIRQSMITVEKVSHVIMQDVQLHSDAGSSELATEADLLAAAVAIGEGLEAEAIHGRDDVTWIGVSSLDSKGWRWALSPLQLSLYDGLGGMAVFFAHLAAATRRGDFEALARAALQPIVAEVSDAKRAAASDVGAFSGEASHIYVLAQLAALWREPALLERALEVLPVIEARIGADESLDVLNGAAGCAVCLLDLYRQTEDLRALEVARRCGDHLLAKALPCPNGGLGWKIPLIQQPLAGFSHGVAGIAWALLELAAATGDERYRDAARRSLIYERSIFLAERGAWQDLRPGAPPPSATGPMMVAWCNGATGVALGRLLSLKHLDAPQARSEIEIGLQTTLREGFGMSHCLCHGDLGNADVLIVASEVLNDPRWHQAALRRTSKALARARAHGFRCGLASSHDVPSLMLGLAGIGLGLLRIRSPETVPSVLSLQPAGRRRPLA